MIGYVHIPKTGGSTMKYVLRNTFGPRHCDVVPFDEDGIFKARDLALARWVHPLGLRSIAGHSLIRPTTHLPETVRCFTFLRDPVTRAASAYQHHVRGRHRIRLGNPLLSLEEYLEVQTSGVNRQVRQLAGGLDLEAAREEIGRYFFVGLVEDFDASLGMLAALSPYPIDTNYLVRNAAPDNRVKEEILADPVKRKRIEQAVMLDQELYEWVRDTLYPAQRERAAEAGGRPRRPRSHAVGRARARSSRLYNQIFYRALFHKARRRLAGPA